MTEGKIGGGGDGESDEQQAQREKIRDEGGRGMRTARDKQESPVV